jgi:hypothetical protein
MPSDRDWEKELEVLLLKKRKFAGGVAAGVRIVMLSPRLV